MKLKSLLLAALLASGLTYTLTEKLATAQAAESLQAETSTDESLTLFETTTLRDDQGLEVGSVSPQQVRILQISSIRRGHGEGYLVPMYLISTWLGDKWIIPDNALMGSEEKMDTYLELSHEERLYDDPGLLSDKGVIGKQTVKVLSRWDRRYKIATPDGERWIAPGGSAITGVNPIQADVQLKAQTKLFRFPNEYDTGASVSPQVMHVTAVWRDWYRADSWLGPVWFRLHELDAVDAGDNVEVGLGARYFDGKQTQIRAQVQLGPKWREQSETIPVSFNVAFYDDKGDRIGVSSGATVHLAGGEPTTADLTVDQNINQFALAIVELGMFNGKIVNRIAPGDPMAISDAANQVLRVGAIQVRQEGAFSVIVGQYEYKLGGAHRLLAELSFLDADGKSIARMPLSLAFDDAYPGSGALRPFEAVVPTDVTKYASLSLKVLEVTDNEAKDILNKLLPKAIGIIGGMFNGSGWFTEDATKPIPGEKEYYLVTGEKWKTEIDTRNVKSIADLKKVIEDVFKKDIAQKLLYSRYLETKDAGLPLYKDYEGRLYANTQNGGHGWATKFLIDTAKIKSQKDNVVEIAIDTTVLDDPYGTLIIKIEYVNGKWLMASGLDNYESIINGSVK
ncbi:MAG: hypothetical protein K0Q94_804 [Paenibacillus sp.]|nr:hypothetical protein [Paenibacillus sp.]